MHNHVPSVMTPSKPSKCISCLAPCADMLSVCIRETSSLKLAKLRGCTFVNQYVVIKYLGRGACGRVFLCMDMTDNRLYAVKVRQLYSGMIHTAALVADVAAGKQQAYHLGWFCVSSGLCASLHNTLSCSLAECTDALRHVWLWTCVCVCVFAVNYRLAANCAHCHSFT